MALTVKIRGDATQFEKTMKNVRSAIGGLGKGMVNLTGQALGFGAALAGIGGTIAVIEKFVDLLKESSDKAANLEELTKQFEVLTGSAEKAGNLIAQFREEATKSPLTTQDYAHAAKTLMSMGSSSEDVMGQLRMLGDVSMGNSERFSSLALAFGQMQAAGRLMGGELNQLIATGFNPLQVISKKTGESVGDLKKKMEAGGISTAMVAEAFKDATSAGGLFYRAIEEGANTFNGKLAQAQDAVDSLKIAFGTGLNEGLKKGLEVAANNLGKFDEIFASLGARAGEAISAAIGEALAGRGELFLAVGEAVGRLILEGMGTVIGGSFKEMVARPFMEWMEGANMGTPEAIAKARTTVEGYMGKPKDYRAEMMDSINRAKDRIGNAVHNAKLTQFDEAESKRMGKLESERSAVEKITKRFTDELRKSRDMLQDIRDELRKDKPLMRR